MEYCIIRTYSAGVFAGYIQSKIGQEVTLTEARRLWKWVGAASLSELAVKGVRYPDECFFPAPVPKVELTNVLEVLYCTSEAKKSIQSVPIWSAWNTDGVKHST